MLSKAQMSKMPHYQSHKIVQAAQIKSITYNENSVPRVSMIVAGSDGDMEIVPDKTWLAKHQPEEGGYLVLYEDGYLSYSPAKPFKAGYTMLHPQPHPDTETAPQQDGAA